MICEHKHLRCTNGVFFCLACGAKLDPPKPTEPKPEPKRPAKRKTKAD